MRTAPTGRSGARRIAVGLLLGATVWSAAGIVRSAGDAPQPAPQTPREALQRLNGFIGEWRGVGQPRRGSNKDAWSEHAGWVWDLQGEQPAIVQHVADGKLIQETRVTYDPTAAEYVVITTSPTGETVTYRGRWEEHQLVLRSPGDDAAPARRITLTPRGDIRFVAFYETTEPGQNVYFRVAEIGYTREGKRLAGPGGGQPQCIVTGGLGTMQVSYKGETYYVCCTGCKQAFEADPEGILKEYRERLAKEREATN